MNMEDHPVRAKFRCTFKQEHDASGWHLNKPADKLYSYQFQAVTGDESPENKEFFNSTPTGYIQLSAVTDNLFIEGQSYYLDFTPAS